MLTRRLLYAGLVFLAISSFGYIVVLSRSVPRERAIFNLQPQGRPSIIMVTWRLANSRIFLQPDRSAPVVGVINSGDTVQVLARTTDDRWTRVNRSNVDGWVAENYRIVVSQPRTAATAQAVIATATAQSQAVATAQAFIATATAQPRIVATAKAILATATVQAWTASTAQAVIATATAQAQVFTSTSSLSPSNQAVTPTMIIQADWPKQMEVDSSDSIRISLVRMQAINFIPTIQKDAEVYTTTLVFGTPGIPIESAFGTEYSASALAKLIGVSFEIAASKEEWGLDQPEISWNWNLVSNKPGVQRVNVTIEGNWKSKTNKSSIQRLMWDRDLEIEVIEPWIKKGQLTVASLIAAFLGSALSIPWLYEKIQARLTIKRQKIEPKSKSKN